MAKVTWPAQDFSFASTTEVVMRGSTRPDLLGSCAVSSSRWASTQALAPVLFGVSPTMRPTTPESMIVLPAPVGATPRVFPCSSSARTLRSTNCFWRGRSSMAASLRPGRARARLRHGGLGRLSLRLRCRTGHAHEGGIILVIRRHRRADLVLLLAVGVGADVDPRHELEPVEIGKAADATRGLGL